MQKLLRRLMRTDQIAQIKPAGLGQKASAAPPASGSLADGKDRGFIRRAVCCKLFEIGIGRVDLGQDDEPVRRESPVQQPFERLLLQRLCWLVSLLNVKSILS